MARFSWSEVFQSIEGEGPYGGWPTVYVRFTGCNFECKGFNNPEGLDTASIEVLGFDPKDYNNINNIPLITKGCDSIYAWDQKFRHMWQTGDENDLAARVMDTIPHHNWRHPVTDAPVILSLTGGEPTLRAKTIPTLLEHPLFEGLTYLLIETNCAVPLSQTFIDYLNKWVDKRNGRKVIWSNSPKLSISGEPYSNAIKPEIANMQLNVKNCEQYFKFVCSSDLHDFDEVNSVMLDYYNDGKIPVSTRVYIMPMACLEEQQQNIAAEVAEACIRMGFIYCHRIQNSVFGNGVGT